LVLALTFFLLLLIAVLTALFLTVLSALLAAVLAALVLTALFASLAAVALLVSVLLHRMLLHVSPATLPGPEGRQCSCLLGGQRK
jgi:hypothetical protein